MVECSSPRQRREGCNSARGIEEVAAVQDGTEGLQWREKHRRLAMVQREHSIAAERASVS